MRFKTILTAISATALVVAPTGATAANPAAKLSVASSARASAKDGDSKFLGSGGWLPVLVLGAVVVAAIIVLENDDDSPDSP